MQLEAEGLRMGRDPNSRALGLVRSLSWKDCIWVSTAGLSEEGPTTKFGRVKKNKILLNIPEREKKVAVERVNWYGTLNPEKNRQRAML